MQEPLSLTEWVVKAHQVLGDDPDPDPGPADSYDAECARKDERRLGVERDSFDSLVEGPHTLEDAADAARFRLGFLHGMYESAHMVAHALKDPDADVGNTYYTLDCFVSSVIGAITSVALPVGSDLTIPVGAQNTPTRFVFAQTGPTCVVHRVYPDGRLSTRFPTLQEATALLEHVRGQARAEFQRELRERDEADAT